METIEGLHWRSGLRARGFDHHVVVITNRWMTWPDVQFHLWKSVRRVHEHVLRRSCYAGVRTDALWWFEAYFERSNAGIPHYHLAMGTDPAVGTQILEALEHEWTRRFSVKRAFLSRPVIDQDNQDKTMAYIAKKMQHSDEAKEAFTTGWHMLPVLCKATAFTERPPN